MSFGRKNKPASATSDAREGRAASLPGVSYPRYKPVRGVIALAAHGLIIAHLGWGNRRIVSELKAAQGELLRQPCAQQAKREQAKGAV